MTSYTVHVGTPTIRLTPGGPPGPPGADGPAGAPAGFEAAQLASALYLDGTAAPAQGVSTPHKAAFNPSNLGAGSFSMRLAAALDDWTPGVAPVLMSHSGPALGDFGIDMVANANGTLSLFFSPTVNSNPSIIGPSNGHALINGALAAIRMDWIASTAFRIMYRPIGILSATDDLAEEGADWLPLFEQLAGVPSTIGQTTAPLYIGGVSGGSFPMIGKVVAARYIVDGVAVADPDFRRGIPPGGRGLRDSFGNYWNPVGALHSWVQAPLGVAAIAP